MSVFGFFMTQAKSGLTVSLRMSSWSGKTSSGTVSSVVWSCSSRSSNRDARGTARYGRMNEPRSNCSERHDLHAVWLQWTDPRTGAHHLAHGRGRSAPRSPRPWVRTTSTTVGSPMGEDDQHHGRLAHGRGRTAPRSPRPWARTTSTTVASPMGEDDHHQGHLAHGRGRSAPGSPRLRARTIQSRPVRLVLTLVSSV